MQNLAFHVKLITRIYGLFPFSSRYHRHCPASNKTMSHCKHLSLTVKRQIDMKYLNNAVLLVCWKLMFATWRKHVIDSAKIILIDCGVTNVFQWRHRSIRYFDCLLNNLFMISTKKIKSFELLALCTLGISLWFNGKVYFLSHYFWKLISVYKL